MVKAPDGADVDSIILLDNLDWLKLSRHSIPACTWVLSFEGIFWGAARELAVKALF